VVPIRDRGSVPAEVLPFDPGLHPMTSPSCRARRSRPGPLLPLALAASACVGYEPAPLDEAALLATLDAERRVAAPDEGIDLATATDWLREQGPAVRDAIAAFRSAEALAAVATPWPDPSIQFGPQIAWGSDVGSSRPVTPFATLSVPIPLGDRLEANDRLNRARAEALRIDAVLALRSEYLGLRGDWARLATARRREALLADLAEATGRAAEAARRLVEAGSATALDAALLELEKARAESRRLDAALGAAESAGALAARTGVALDRFDRLREDGLPEAPGAAIDAVELRALMLEHRPELVERRAGYAVAEAALRLEVELQYPDFQIGLNYSAEAGEQRDQLGLGIGMRLPIFDRNQQAIARAAEQREQARTGYVNAASRALAALETQVRRVALTSARRRTIEEDVLTRAEANVELARRAVAAGATDALRLLDVLRSWSALRVEALEARLDEIDAWIALEQVVGHPLLAFPGEPAAPPAPPAEIENPDRDEVREESAR
jgi:cobalt-zinc-cadmium efflux system outer membrane protein